MQLVNSRNDQHTRHDHLCPVKVPHTLCVTAGTIEQPGEYAVFSQVSQFADEQVHDDEQLSWQFRKQHAKMASSKRPVCSLENAALDAESTTAVHRMAGS